MREPRTALYPNGYGRNPRVRHVWWPLTREVFLLKKADFAAGLCHGRRSGRGRAFALEYHVHRLRKHGVKLVSITQDLGEDPMSVMVRQVFVLFDEYQSKENAKHTLRAMQENARQGFWNGAKAPYGYTVVAAEQRGSKTKKRLAIDPMEAETVRLIYRLLREGDGVSGPLGMKSMVNWLNVRGYRTRAGARWAIGPLYQRGSSLRSATAFTVRLKVKQRDRFAIRLREVASAALGTFKVTGVGKGPSASLFG
jgi:hypothetical protein